MKYDKSEPNFLGKCDDYAGNEVHAFEVEDEMHLVRHYGKVNERIAKEKIADIISEPDEYLFTPYALFMHKVNQT
jgi:hypothetical protein